MKPYHLISDSLHTFTCQPDVRVIVNPPPPPPSLPSNPLPPFQISAVALCPVDIFKLFPPLKDD